MKLEEAIQSYKELKKHKELIKNIDTDFFFEFAETVLQALERYKRLAEANLTKRDEFMDNMCEHRCILKSELQEFQENTIPKKKIEDILEKLDSKKVEERVIKFYTSDKKHYYETDKYNDIIRQVLQEL